MTFESRGFENPRAQRLVRPASAPTSTSTSAAATNGESILPEAKTLRRLSPSGTRKLRRPSVAPSPVAGTSRLAGPPPRPVLARNARPTTTVLKPKSAPSITPKPAPLPPTSRKVKVIGASVGTGLLAIIGVLVWMNSNKVDPGQIIAELKAEIETVNQLPLEEVIEKDKLIHSILENETYSKYGGETLKQIDRSHSELHAQAEAEKRARETAKRFLVKYETLKTDRERLKKEAQKFHDEVKSLRDQFASTAYGPRLLEVDRELQAVLKSQEEEAWEVSFIPMKQKSDRAASNGDFASALASIDEFGARHRENEHAELASKLAGLRESLHRKGDAQIEALIRRAKQLSEEGRQPAAVSLVELERGKFQGIPQAWKLDEYLKANR